MSSDRVAKIIEDIFAGAGSGQIPATYATAGWGDVCTTADPPTLDSIAATMKKFQDDRREVDAGMVRALSDYIARSNDPPHVWAARLRVSWEEFVETLEGRRPISWHFWEEVRRVFGPLRPSA